MGGQRLGLACGQGLSTVVVRGRLWGIEIVLVNVTRVYIGSGRPSTRLAGRRLWSPTGRPGGSAEAGCRQAPTGLMRSALASGVSWFDLAGVLGEAHEFFFWAPAGSRMRLFAAELTRVILRNRSCCWPSW